MRNIFTLFLTVVCTSIFANPVNVDIVNKSGFKLVIHDGKGNKRTIEGPGSADFTIDLDRLMFAYILDSNAKAISDKTFMLFDPEAKKRQVRVDENGNFQWNSSPSEMHFAKFYEDYYRDKKNVDFLQYIKEHSNNLSSAQVIGFFKCRSITSSDEIDSLYKLLGPQVQASTAGRKIINYLNARKNLQIGKEVSDFSLLHSSGSDKTLYSIPSRYILLDFWFSTCGPCILSFPKLQELYRTTDRKNLEIVGISVDQDEAKWKESIEKHQISWTQLLDKGYSVPAKTFAIEFYPTTILIDNATKKIVAINPTPEEIKAFLKS